MTNKSNSKSKYKTYAVNTATIAILVTLLLLSAIWYTYSQNIKTFSQIKIGAENNYQKISLFRIAERERKAKLIHIETPESVRAIYISSWVAGHKRLRSGLIEFIENSEINSVVIDIKDSTGVISFKVEDEFISSFGTDSTRVSDISELIKILHEKDIYIIGRLTAFQDPLLAKRNPKLAFSRKDNGKTWKDRKGLAFINPKENDAHEYLLALAEYSYKIGFDEINFDYIRYPSDGKISNLNYDLSEGETRSDVMLSFYKKIQAELGEKNIPVSADLFGLTTSVKEGDDLGIGQILTDALPYFDAIGPMVYPSHYSSGYFGLDVPDDNPYKVIMESMGDAKEKAVLINEDPQKLRAWIQDFSISRKYGTADVKAQLKALDDLGLNSYMVWDPKNKYTKNAYE